MAKVECELVTQDAIDVEIGSGLGAVLQGKIVEITENGTAVVKPDDGFDGLQFVEINTNTPENITGVIGAPDGMSFAQLLCSSAYSSVTEIVDTNVGWTMTSNKLGLFPNVKHVSLCCEIIDVTPSTYTNFISSSIYESISFKGTKKVYVRNPAGCVYVPNGIVDFSDLEEFYGYVANHGIGFALISACANEKVDLHRLRKVERTGTNVGTTCVPIIANSPNVKDIDLSSIS